MSVRKLWQRNQLIPNFDTIITSLVGQEVRLFNRGHRVDLFGKLVSYGGWSHEVECRDRSGVIVAKVRFDMAEVILIYEDEEGGFNIFINVANRSHHMYEDRLLKK